MASDWPTIDQALAATEIMRRPRDFGVAIPECVAHILQFCIVTFLCVQGKCLVYIAGFIHNIL